MNVLSFDIININREQVKIFAVKFNGNIFATRTSITNQETISIEFSNEPGEHTLEFSTISPDNSPAGVAIGNFKFNHHECYDAVIWGLCEGYWNDGVLQGTSKVTLCINTPILEWQNKFKIY